MTVFDDLKWKQVKINMFSLTPSIPKKEGAGSVFSGSFSCT